MIGSCDICNAQDVELSRSELAGLEAWSCTDGCPKFKAFTAAPAETPQTCVNSREEFLTKRLAERGALVEDLKIEKLKLLDILARAFPAVELCYLRETSEPRWMRWRSVLNAIRDVGAVNE